MINFILPIVTVLIGYLFVLVFKPTKQKNLKLLLAFSGAFLLSITVFNFLPEVFNNNNDKTIGLFIMIGILLQIILEFFSKGAEHGHVHLSKNESVFPWLLFISLSIHSVLEGLPIEAHDNLIYGIIIHKTDIFKICYLYSLIVSILVIHIFFIFYNFDITIFRECV